MNEIVEILTECLLTKFSPALLHVSLSPVRIGIVEPHPDEIFIIFLAEFIYSERC
jgi:hypothetical protein